jgi:hypothetical protein
VALLQTAKLRRVIHTSSFLPILEYGRRFFTRGTALALNSLKDGESRARLGGAVISDESGVMLHV